MSNSATTSFFWYDFETTGVDPAKDRPMQFAGIRTDLDFNPIGEPIMLYCKLADDVLPHPDACLLTGITPQDAIREGLKEYSNWPTFPQLYFNGKLVGGNDIITEMYQEGELQELLNS